MAGKIENWDDVIDSRDVVARIEQLEADRSDHEGSEASHSESWADSEPDDAEELGHLTKLLEQLRDVGGDTPEDGQTIIRESYFQDYAQELWEDTADSSDRELATKWPYRHIDWDEAADELKVDYTSVDFDGVTYYVR